MMTDQENATIRVRPAVSVVVPFAGEATEARTALAALRSLRLRPGDEVIVADNTVQGVIAKLGDERVRVIPAGAQRSSYHARNVGAEQARNEWILFLDADVRPAPSLLDDFFVEPIDGSVGALAGRIVQVAAGKALAETWATTREHLSQERSMELPYGAAAATPNLLIRREAWAAVGGFIEGIRSGGDIEIGWRLRDAGWRLELREGAVVEHPADRTVAGLARQVARWGSGNAWHERRHPGSSPRPVLGRELARSIAGVGWFGLTAQFKRAALKAVDGVVVTSRWLGYLRGNAAPRESLTKAPPGSGLVICTDAFPVPSETFVESEMRALARLGLRVRMEAIARPPRPQLGADRDLRVDYIEDAGAVDKARAIAWLAGRHPLRCMRDFVWRRRWDPEERVPLRVLAPVARRIAQGGEGHIHVHFAAAAAVHALRAGRLAGASVSIAAHGHEIFPPRRGLPEKLAAADFVAAPCEYTAAHLREVGGPSVADRVHTIVMGVDGERFRRTRPYPSGRTVVAVGRLVEKKGFEYLLEATARLNGTASLERLVIAGDGPLATDLRARAEALELGGRVVLPGALSPGEVRKLLEEAALFAMPCVIARNGDRDAMPVVVKEALAMEVPVVASDEVGLPEVLRPPWGRLVPPGDPAALATAVTELLSLPPEERAAMGRAGRRFVLERFTVDQGAEKLKRLISSR